MNLAKKVIAIILLSCFFISIIPTVSADSRGENAPVYTDKAVMIQQWKNLEATYPQYITHEVIGYTARGNPLYIFRIGNPNGAKVMIDGSIHGSEDTGSQATYDFTTWLVSSNEQRAKNILAGNYLLVIPYINYDMPWRKNANGVDLARNFPHNWGHSGSSTPSEWDYRGPSADSEPETKAMVNTLQKYKPIVYINMHCGMRLINYASRTQAGLDIGAKINSLYQSQIASTGIPNRYPNWGRSSSGSSGSLYGQAYNVATVAFLFETQTWAELPVSLAEWRSVWYPGIKAVFIAALESVQTTSNTTPQYPNSDTIFQDGFESGNLNAWSGTTSTNGESIAITTSLKHDNTYAIRCTSNGNGGFENAYAYKYLPSAQTNLYAQGYFQVTTSGLAQNDDRFYFLRFQSSSGNDLAYAGWRVVNGELRWSLIVRDGTNWVTKYSATIPNTGQWYSVELHWKAGYTDGLGELYVNNVNVASLYGINTAVLGNVNIVRAGLAELYNCAPTTVYADSITVSNTRIG